MSAQTSKIGFDSALVAVEEKLKIATALRSAGRKFLKKMLECHERIARDVMPTAFDAVFFAETLPAVSSLLQYCAQRENYLEALRWAQVEFPDRDPHSLLIALTYVYLVAKGYEEVETEPEWEKIKDRSDRFFAPSNN